MKGCLVGWFWLRYLMRLQLYVSWGYNQMKICLHFHFSLSCIGEGNGNPLQCSCLENPRDGGAWWAAIYGIAQSWTQLKRLSSSSSSRYRWRQSVRWKLDQKKISRLKCEQKDKKSRKEHKRYVGYSKKLKYKYLESQQEKKKEQKQYLKKLSSYLF